MERLDAFLADLPTGHRFAIEFRHDSWRVPEVTARLRRAGVALCAAELGLEESAPESTAEFAYVRLRKPPPYDESDISAATALLEKVAATVEDTYVYAKHDDVGVAPEQVKKIARLTT